MTIHITSIEGPYATSARMRTLMQTDKPRFAEIAQIICDHRRHHRGTILHGMSKKHEFVVTRWLVMYYAKLYTGLSYARIGGLMAGRDHSTVLHGVKKVKAAMAVNDEVFKISIDEIDELLATKGFNLGEKK